MALISIRVPSGVIGNIEAALIRAGFGVLDSSEFAQHIITDSGSINFTSSKLRKAGIDPTVLAQELRDVGLIVHWTGDHGPAA